MDQFFDRLGTLFRSFLNGEDDDSDDFAEPGKSRSGDPFLDEAMEELDAFLSDDREKAERLRAREEARRRAEEASRGSAGHASGPPLKLVAAYRELGLSYGAPFDAVRASYKKLLKQHHPDKHGSDAEAQRRATESCARINNAYRIIETWKETGSLGDE